MKNKINVSLNMSRSFSLLRKVIDNVPAMITVYSLKTGEYIYVNNSIRKLLGYTSADFIKKGLPFATSLVHPDDLPKIMKENSKALKKANNPAFAKKVDQQIVQFEYRMKHKKGHWVWLKTDGSVFQRNQNNKVEYVLNVSIDITTRKKTEDSLLSIKQQLEGAITTQTQALNDTVQDLANIKYALDQSSIVAITDKGGVIQYVNDKFVEISKYPREELIGKTHRVINSKYHSREYIKTLWDTILSGNVWHGELRNRAKNGRFYWVDTTITPLLGNDKKPKQFIAIRNDITKRKELEQKKDEFISVASHELKTPLTTVKAYAQLLRRLAKKEKNTLFLSYINRMDTQMEKIISLIHDLLDTTRIQAGRLKLRKSTFNVKKLVEEVSSDIETISSEHLIHINDIPPHTITADRERISQVLQNLLTNATKYSPFGSTVSIGCKKADGQLVIYVKDEGFGISEDEQEKIFSRFYQVDKHVLKHAPSLGLGLYISREIITRHGGNMWVKSKEGQGSTFYFSLPIDKTYS